MVLTLGLSVTNWGTINSSEDPYTITPDTITPTHIPLLPLPSPHTLGPGSFVGVMCGDEMYCGCTGGVVLVTVR